MKDNLPHEIMNLPCKPPIIFPHCSCSTAYKEGHRDARHAAAELVAGRAAAAQGPSGTLFIRSDDRNYAAARDEESRTYPVTPAAQDSAPTSGRLLYEIMNLPAHPRDLPGTFSSGWISGHKDALYQAAKLVTAFASAPNTRDPWRGGESYEASMLRNLLSIIHGQGQCDGYRYIEEHGLEKALTDAGAKVMELFNKTAAAPTAPTPTQPVAMIEPADARRLADELEQLRLDHWSHWNAQENNIAATAVRHLRLLGEQK